MQTCDEALFWYWISERHRIYLNRQAGGPKPWTQDPIFQQYKFVNVFRRLDRTTKWLIENFLEPHKSDDPALLAFNICWFRCFNRWETGQLLGWQTEWDEDLIWEKLVSANFPVFTGAYIIHSEPGESKLGSMIEVADDLSAIRQNIVQLSKDTNSMKDVWRLLQAVRHIGQFMAYQMVLDMMYTPLLENAPDRKTWTCTGPGALRGLRRLDSAATMEDSLAQMQNLQRRSSVELRKITATHVPPLDIHDIEFCLCELDKYCRVKFGEGRPRSTYLGV